MKTDATELINPKMNKTHTTAFIAVGTFFFPPNQLLNTLTAIKHINTVKKLVTATLYIIPLPHFQYTGFPSYRD